MEFSQGIIEIFDELCKKIGVAIDWSAENIMPYIKELFERFIKFEIGTSIFYIALSVFVCIVVGIVAIISYKPAKKVDFDEDFVVAWVFGVSVVASIVLSIAAIIVIGNQIYDIIQSIYLPEKTLYDFVMFQKVKY